MNEKVKAHYDSHLADVYSWMAGDFREKVNQTREFFIKNNIKPSSTHSTIDLGSGHGIQSAALAEIGFDVTAVDFSEKLLLELKQNTANKVKTINLLEPGKYPFTSATINILYKDLIDLIEG